MKKRLFTLALVVGVVLSMCASAWAVTAYCKIESVDLSTKALYEASKDQAVSLELAVRLGAIVAEANPNVEGYTECLRTMGYVYGYPVADIEDKKKRIEELEKELEYAKQDYEDAYNNPIKNN